MRSFKEFLKEESNVNANANLRIHIECKHKNKLANYNEEVKFEKIVKKLVEDSGLNYDRLQVAQSSVGIYCNLNNQIQFDHNKIQKLYAILRDTVDYYCGEISNSSLELMLLGIPNFPIELDNGFVSIYCRKKESISNLDKKIIKCDFLRIYNADEIVGGVLSLLKMKVSFNIEEASAFGSIHVKWYKIISKHLKSGRRLSKCKEELIEAGLQEFAKL